MNSFDNYAELLQDRFEKRRNDPEVNEALKEVGGLLNNDIEAVNKFLYGVVMVFMRYNPEQAKIEQEALKRAKKLKIKILKKAFEVHELMSELDGIASENIEAEWNFPHLTPLQIIQDASKFSYGLEQDRMTAKRQKKLYDRTLGKTVNKLLKSEVDDYCPCPKYMFYAVAKFYEAHVFKDTHRQTSPRTLLRAILKDLIYSVKHELLPKEILQISHKSMTNIINVSLDLSVDKLIDVDNTRHVFSEFF